MTARLLRLLFAALACMLLASLRLHAQCSFGLDVTIVKHSDCASNGIIKVSLSGSEVNLAHVQIRLTGSNGTDITSTTNGQEFSSLAAASYTVTASTICNGSGLQVTKTEQVQLTSSYTSLNTYVGNVRKSLNCKYTGMIPIHIFDGRAPYKIKITASPGTYSGSMDFTYSGTDVFELDDLPPGLYAFTVTDDCGYGIPLLATVATVSSDFPINPYQDNLHLATPPSNTCNRVSVIANDANADLDYYWNQNRDKYYEVAFSVNGSTPTWVATESERRQVISLPYTIKQMRDYGFSVDVHLRIKGCVMPSLFADNITVYDPSVSYGYTEMTCTSYKLFFYPSYYNDNATSDYSNNTLICYPYSWEVYETGNPTRIASMNGITNGDAQNVGGLDYSKTYELIITDSEGTQIKQTFSTGRELYSYWQQKYCPPNLYLSYLNFYWPNSPIPAGTRIRQLMGTTTATHADVTLARDVHGFYPFSSNYEVLEYVEIKDGIYRFEITNTCGDPPYIAEIYVTNYETQGLSYTAQQECDGLHVFPQGEIFYGGTAQTAYYVLSEAPAGVSTGMFTSHDTGQYFLLPKTGRYVIEMRQWPGDCAIDTVVIDYTHESFMLDYATAYTCQAGDNTPRFFVRAKEGKAPYQYDLYENGVPVASNATGDFVYGSVGNTYSVKATDACNRSFTVQLQVLDLSYDLIISGTDRVCLGGTIQLQCITLGSTVFLWQGPNGFMATTQNAERPNATLNDAGIYTLTLQPRGCFSPVTQQMNVDVYVPSKPAYADVIDICLNESYTLPDPALLPDHTAVWFMSDGVTECPKPVISTATAHEEVYYIGQKDNTLGCLGELHRLTVKVHPLPATSFSVTSDLACFKGSPTLRLSNLNPSFTYNIYPDRSQNNSLAAITGVASDVVSFTDELEQGTPYYIRVTDQLGCVSEPLEEVVEILIIAITPDIVASYQKDKDYRQQLETNGVQPVFTLVDGELPTGLWLNFNGLISGKVLTDKIGPFWSFTVRVVDANGCTGDKAYAMDGDFFVPKVFSPNGDGINDVFMSGFGVVIFDRLGITIFEGDNGWDGTHKGKPADPDIYFYKLTHTTVNGNNIEKTGYIGLER